MTNYSGSNDLKNQFGRYWKPGQIFPPVRTKADFVKRYQAGEFGNCSPTWDTFYDWAESSGPYTGDALFHIRNRVSGGPTHYNVRTRDMSQKWRDLLEAGTDPKSMYISAMAPTEKTTFQGEVMQSERGSLELFYTRVAKPMRDALKQDAHRTIGITAATLLRTYMCPRSHDWLQILLDRYPEHVVEFSCYSVEWGTLPGYNTCFWEIRSY